MFMAHTAFGKAEVNAFLNQFLAQSTAIARQSPASSIAISELVDILNNSEQKREFRIDFLNFVSPSSNAVVPHLTARTDCAPQSQHFCDQSVTKAHPLNPPRISKLYSLFETRPFIYSPLVRPHLTWPTSQLTLVVPTDFVWKPTDLKRCLKRYLLSAARRLYASKYDSLSLSELIITICNWHQDNWRVFLLLIVGTDKVTNVRTSLIANNVADYSTFLNKLIALFKRFQFYSEYRASF